MPRNLTDHDRAQCATTSQEIVDDFESDHVKFVRQIDTGDETWVYHWDPESKVESMQWRHASSPSPGKFRMLPSAGKLMATIFGTVKDYCYDYLPPKTTMNGQYCASLLVKMRDAIKEKCRKMLT